MGLISEVPSFARASTLYGTFLCRPYMTTKSNARYENRVAHATHRERVATCNFWARTELLLLDKRRQGSSQVVCRKTILLRVNLGIERKIFVLRLNYQTYKQPIPGSNTAHREKLWKNRGGAGERQGSGLKALFSTPHSSISALGTLWLVSFWQLTSTSLIA